MLVDNKQKAYTEAMRYIDNAREILTSKAGKDGKFYKDRKYVKMAGNTIWNGVLLAMDYKFPEIKAATKKGRADVNSYKEVLAKHNKKMLNYFNSTYESAHLAMGYDGHLSSLISKDAIENSEVIIKWATS